MASAALCLCCYATAAATTPTTRNANDNDKRNARLEPSSVRLRFLRLSAGLFVCFVCVALRRAVFGCNSFRGVVSRSARRTRRPRRELSAASLARLASRLCAAPHSAAQHSAARNARPSQWILPAHWRGKSSPADECLPFHLLFACLARRKPLPARALHPAGVVVPTTLLACRRARAFGSLIQRPPGAARVDVARRAYAVAVVVVLAAASSPHYAQRARKSATRSKSAPSELSAPSAEMFFRRRRLHVRFGARFAAARQKRVRKTQSRVVAQS